MGIHSAGPVAGGEDALPAYVKRSFDFQLRLALSADLPDRGALVVMVGGSSTGKTRSLYEAVLELVPNWRLMQPAEVSDLLDLLHEPPRSTVLWLDEMQHYLGGPSAQTAVCVTALVRNGNLVVGTLWPDQYAKWTAGREPVHKLMQRASVISVPESLDRSEQREARGLASQDSRIRDALSVRDVGMTQVLAGGPRLVMCWEQPANAYVKAMIAAAADAHRLGVQSPLSEELLADAMFGYLRPHQRVRSAEYWLAEALPHATERIHGDVSALYEVDAGRPGTLAGYTIADYLAEHVRSKLRSDRVPHAAWQALVTHLRRPDDLRRLAAGAAARLRYHYAEGALTRLALEFGDRRAAVELADLLVRQDRFTEAAEILRRRLTGSAEDEPVVRKLDHVQAVWRRAKEIRDRPAEVAELLFDGGLGDQLRREAAGGNAIAADRLVELLADRGCLHELRYRTDRLGERRAAEALADLHAAWGDVDELRSRAARGDRAAELRISKAHRHERARFQIEQLRAQADEGRAEAALQLCTLLFELRDEEQLKVELNAGTPGAADRLIALYTAQDHPSLIRLRAFGLDADGQLVTQQTPP
ncbi:hypothetical protein AB0J83_39670 [Actinoplanes sp. NPDC049596]|uniref:hypothetical protein n=1 Tax=unclassified Actinoplanes TaxID=2626549 RepID=UPI003415B955